MFSDDEIKHMFEELDLDTEEKRRRFKEIAALSERRRGGPVPQHTAATITTNTQEDTEDA